MLRELGVDFYRFSISWPRLLPSGFSDKVSRDGVLYYTNLIDELLRNNITPVVTLYHWDLPNRLQELGGWSNPLMSGYYLEYARVVFEYFGTKVKTWITFNGPSLICTNGYGTDMNYAPSVQFQGVMEYLCGHHILLAHSAVYDLYSRDYKPIQQGKISTSISQKLWTAGQIDRWEFFIFLFRTCGHYIILSLGRAIIEFNGRQRSSRESHAVYSKYKQNI